MTEPAPAATPAKPTARERWIRVGLCAVMATWVLSFTPRPLVVGTWTGLVAGLALVERPRRTREALWWVVLFAAVVIGYGYRWLADTARTFGEFDRNLGPFAVPASWLVLGAYGVAGTLHGLLFVALYRATIRPDRRPHPLFTVTLFVACETLPIRFLPWMAGYGAVEVAPLRQVAEWGGVPLVSFALLCLVVPVHEAIRWKWARTGAPARAKAALVTAGVGVVLAAVGAWRHAAVVSEDDAAPKRVRVAIVQGNVGAEVKRSEERGEATRRSRTAYRRGTQAAVERKADLVVWPETAVGDAMRLWDARAGRPVAPAVAAVEQRRVGIGWLEDFGRDRAVLFGGYVDEESPGPADGPPRETVRYNAAILREAGASAWSIYRKTRLIPFGETMPGASWFPSLKKVLPQGFEMRAGERPQPPLRWAAKGLVLATFVCYEDILPDDVRGIAGDERPDLLVNLTNDSWFGDTWEPHQHLNFSRFRAVEHGVPLVRATNTGVSAFVSAGGEVLDRLDVGVEGILVRDVPLVSRSRTLYAATGGLQRWAWWAVAAAGFWWTRRRRPAAA